ncbi:MAG: hypothetical protein Q9190_006364, partial [Brigantiaea leucoxantha]
MDNSPQSGRPTADTRLDPRQGSLTTDVLVTNLHCASCASYVRDVLAVFEPAVTGVEVNVISQRVQIIHYRILSTSVLLNALSDAAFDLYAASTVDEAGGKVEEFHIERDSAHRLEAEEGLWNVSRASGFRNHLADSSRSNRERKHVENCDACRIEKRMSGPPTKIKPERKFKPFRPCKSNRLSFRKVSSISPSDTGQKLARNFAPAPLLKTKSKEQSTNDLHEKRITISIKGMTCATCTNSVSEALKGLEFVRKVDVNLLTNTANVVFQGMPEWSSQLIAAVEDIGFEATLFDDGSSTQPGLPSDRPSSNTLSSRHRSEAIISIQGMTCAACTSKIQESLQALPYVEDVQVVLITNSAKITFTGSEHLEEILERIEELGYDCSVELSKSLSEQPDERKQEDVPQERSIMLKVQGMFCDHCPPRLVEALRSAYLSSVTVEQEPSLKVPIIKVRYAPSPPSVTIRTILDALNNVDDRFTASVFHPQSLEERSQAMQLSEKRKLQWRLVLSLIIAIPTFLIGIVWMNFVDPTDRVRRFFDARIGPGIVTRSQWALFTLATPVMFCAADVFHVRAIKEIRALWRKGSRVPFLRRFYRFGSMSLLISAGTFVAYFSSLAIIVVGTCTDEHSMMEQITYFDSVVFLTFFILIGRYLEAYSKARTGDAVAMLGKLRPQEANLVGYSSSGDSGLEQIEITEKDVVRNPETRKVAVDLLELRDVVVVFHGASPPADGIIVKGSTKFNESSLTGESRDITKNEGDHVFAGAVNTGGNPVQVVITNIGGSSMLDQIISVVREGQAKRAPVERVVDRITGYFVPVITALAILTFVIWFSLGQSGALSATYIENQQGGWAFWSLSFAIAVFVVACPCGIGLAAPTALFVGGGLAAKSGILVRGGGEAFQEASNIDAVVFDKTGTLTEGGQPQVTNHQILVGKSQIHVVWSVIRNLEESSSHPLARALLELSLKRSSTQAVTESIEEIPGRGLRGVFVFPTMPGVVADGKWEAAIGSEAFICDLLLPDSLDYFTTQSLSTWKTETKSVALLALRRLPDDEVSPVPQWSLGAIFAMTDLIRPSAAMTVSALQSRNIPVYMLTGDNPATASAVASSLSIPADHVFAGVLPTEKA